MVPKIDLIVSKLSFYLQNELAKVFVRKPSIFEFIGEFKFSLASPSFYLIVNEDFDPSDKRCKITSHYVSLFTNPLIICPYCIVKNFYSFSKKNKVLYDGKVLYYTALPYYYAYRVLLDNSFVKLVFYNSVTILKNENNMYVGKNEYERERNVITPYYVFGASVSPDDVVKTIMVIDYMNSVMRGDSEDEAISYLLKPITYWYYFSVTHTSLASEYSVHYFIKRRLKEIEKRIGKYNLSMANKDLDVLITRIKANKITADEVSCIDKENR